MRSWEESSRPFPWLAGLESWRERSFQPIPLAIRGFLEVRNHVWRSIVAGVRIEQRQVFLPDSFDSRYLGEPQIGNFFIRSWTARRDRFDAVVHLPHALPRPVVDDHDLWLDRVEERGRSCAVECAVAAGLIDGYSAQLVYRAAELHLLLPVEIDQIQVSKLAIARQHARHALIFESNWSFLFRGGTKRIGPAAVDRLRQNLLIRGDHEDTKSLDRDLISRLDDGALACGGSRVAVQPLLIFLLDGIAVVVEFANGQHFGEIGRASCRKR